MTTADELRHLQAEARAAELADPCPGCGLANPACDCPADDMCLSSDGRRAATVSVAADSDDLP